MRTAANVLVGLGALGLLIGLVLRLAASGVPGDPVFFWRGSMGLVTVGIALVLMQIRDK